MKGVSWGSRLSIAVAAATVIFLLPAAAADGFLDLYSSDGTYIQARVVKVVDGRAEIIRKDDGRRFQVPVDRFDEESQKKLRAIESGGTAGGGRFDLDPEINTGNKRLFPRTKGEIAEAMATIRGHADGQSFGEDERNAVYNLNVYRYLAGLSYETVLSEGLCASATKAAEGCKAIGRLDHGANKEAGKCNLHSGGGMASSIHGYMNDGGSSNREHRAHRAWCLSPKLGRLGVGSSGRYSAMWTMDRSASSKIKGEFFSYPGPGHFPRSWLRGNAWTVYFPGKSRPSKDELEVKVYKIAKVPDKPYRPGEVPEGGVEVAVNYYSISKWVTPCVNFEPAIEKKDGRRYWVSIKGGDFKAAFLVELYDL